MPLGIPPVTVDWTINVGTLIQALIFVGSIIALYFAMKSDIRVIRHDMKTLEQRQAVLHEAFTQLGTLLTTVAVQKTELEHVREDIREMKHGRGFVKDGQ